MKKKKKDEIRNETEASVEETKEVTEEEKETEKASENKEEKTYVLTEEEFKQAEEHVANLQKEKEEAIGLLQRTQADFDNFRRRNASIRTDSLAEGKRDCIKALLPVLDNFERAMETECDVQGSWKEGIELVQKQLLDELKKLGLEEIDASGQFDPNLHNAVMQEKVEGKESGEIIAVFQKGYRVGDKILRHSMVKVAE